MATGFSPVTTVNTGAGYAAQVTPQILWQKTVDRYEENSDWWQSLEGAGKNSVIVTKTDLGGRAGQKMRIRVGSGYYDEPHYGDAAFSDENDFEQEMLSEYDLDIDVVRHAISYNERAGQLTGLDNEISTGVPERIGDWMGRLKSENLDMMFRHQLPAENYLFPNGKVPDTIVTADGLSWNYVMNAGGYLSRMGGQRAAVGKEIGGSAAMRLSLIASRTALITLRQDADYAGKVVNAGVRGLTNPIFRGVTTDIDGIAIVERDIIDHDGEGAIGSPQEPRAKLGVAIAAGTGALDILGGGNPTSAAKTKKKYFKYFGGYAYRFANGITLAPPAATRYLLVINPPNAPVDPNKIGFYSYTTGNDGNKITLTGRLIKTATAEAGIGKHTLGAVTWDAAPWLGKQTEVHPAGALILEANAFGEPIGYSFLVGRAAALRGYGKYRNKRGSNTEEDEFLTKVFVRSYFGQKPRLDRIGRAPGVCVLVHALHYPDLPLPKVA